MMCLTADYYDLHRTATGGTVTTSGDYKIHTFNSTSNFVVSQVSNQSHTVEYLVVAGGGGSTRPEQEDVEFGGTICRWL